MRLKFIVLCTWILAVSVAAGETSTSTASPVDAKPIRILFIGNSLTIQNNLPYELTALAASMTPPVKIEAAMVATGGFTFEKHWNGEKAAKKIQEGNWDYVVLQDHSSDPVTKADSMKQYARLLDAEIKKVKAKGLMYQTWALQKTPDDQAAITAAYDELGKELGNTVVPVGTARLNAVKGDATINFYVKDGKHPTPAATYLAACTFFKVITGKTLKTSLYKILDPKDPKKVLVDVKAELGAYLQKIADETVKN